MIDPNPPVMYLSPHVDKVLLKMKLRNVSINTVNHSLPLGKGLPLETKNIT